VYLKLFIPGSLPAKFEKCLYIDCDTYLNDNLDEVFKIDFNTQIAAVKKNTNSIHIFKGEQSKYFNAGVLLFNLKLISKTQLMDKARTILLEYPDLPFQDQDVLNIIYKDSWSELPESYNYFPWNFMNSTKYKSEDIKIIHFIGPIKPWSLESPYSDWWLKWRLEFEKFTPNSLLVTKRNRLEYQFLRKIGRAKAAQFITRLLPYSLKNLVAAIYSKPRN
jgi:lipopolysaccharide biosynthesis glycosyltransferase